MIRLCSFENIFPIYHGRLLAGGSKTAYYIGMIKLQQLNGSWGGNPRQKTFIRRVTASALPQHCYSLCIGDFITTESSVNLIAGSYLLFLLPSLKFMIRGTSQSGNKSLLWVSLCRWFKENLIPFHLAMHSTFILLMSSKWKSPLSSSLVLLQLIGKPGVLNSCAGGKLCPERKHITSVPIILPENT